MVKTRFVYFLACLFMLLMLPVHAASITAKTDRMNVTLDESFTLTFTAEGDVDREPDFAPLKKDFDILGQSQGSNISIINGSYSKSTTYSLSLMPKRAGNLLIPAIAFGKDKSQPLALSVGAATTRPAQDAELILDISASSSNVWIQSQILIKVKLMSAVSIRQYGIGELETGLFDVRLEALGDARQYQTTVNNRNMLVIEQVYALYPQQAGKLVIDPVLAEAEAAVQSRNFFDPFNMRSKTLRARSRAIEINVKDIPAAYTGRNWLPAADVQLVEEWSPNPPVFRVGEPVTRTLNLFADGLTAAQLPELTGADIKDIKQYPDQPVLNDDKRESGIIGGRREKIALIPTRAGSYTLPAVEITWWNTRTGKNEIARLDERVIQVEAGATTVMQTPLTQAGDETTDAPSGDSTLPVPANTSASIYLWISLATGTGWLITALAWWHSLRRNKQPVITQQKPSPTNTLQAIKKACDSHDAAACRKALLAWAQQHYGEHIHSLDELASPSSLALEIEQLQHALYSAHPDTWNGNNLWKELKNLDNEKQANSRNTDRLEPLYK